MEKDYFIDCIENEGESSLFDFKRDIYDFKDKDSKKEFLKDILSFANGHSVGDKYIITGVKLFKDNSRELYGVDETKIQDGADYQNFINDNIEPSLIVDFIPLLYKGLTFCIFKIGKENIDKPYIMKKKYDDLDVGFMKIRVGQRNSFITRRDLDKMYSLKVKEEKSDIFLRGIVDGEVSNKFEMKRISEELLNNSNLKELEKIISKTYNKIENTHLGKIERLSPWNSMYENVSIEEDVKNEIVNYANLNNINLDDSFFNLGYLTSINYGFGKNLDGTEEEKNKYKLIYNLQDEILQYKGLIEFKSKLKLIYYTELLFENVGNRYDEDVQITLKISQDAFLNFLDFPTPNKDIIKNIIDSDFLDRWIKINKHKNVNVHNIDDKYISPVYPKGYSGVMPGQYFDPTPEEYANYYHEYVDYLIDYNIVYSDGNYYIKCIQKQIKPNERVFLPTRLFFTNKIEYIDYEINSKYNQEIKKGRIELSKTE